MATGSVKSFWIPRVKHQTSLKSLATTYDFDRDEYITMKQYGFENGFIIYALNNGQCWMEIRDKNRPMYGEDSRVMFRIGTGN